MKLSVIVSYITLFVSIVGNLISARFILQYIGSEYYGLYSFSISLTSYISIISTALSSSYVRYATVESQKDPNNLKKVNTIYSKLMLLLGTSLLIVALVIVSIFYLSGFSLPQYSPDIRWVVFTCIYLSIFNVFVTIITTVFSLFCNYKRSFLFLRLISLATSFLTSLSSVLISLIIGFSSINATLAPILLAISSLSIQLVTNIIIMAYSIKKQKMTFAKTSLSQEKSFVKSIIGFSSILLISAIVDSINTAADSTILGFFSTGDYVTRYHYAHSFSTYLMTASSAISMTFIPKIHELSISGKKVELNNLFLKICKFQMIVIFLIVGGFLTVGKEFISLWLGSEYIDIFYYALVYLILSTVPLTINISIEVQRSIGKHKFRAYAYLIIAFLNVLVSVLLVNILPKELSVWGCIVGTVISSVLGIWVLMNVYNYKVIHLPIPKYFVNYVLMLLITAASSFFTMVIFYYVDSFITPPLIISFLFKGFSFVTIYLLLQMVFNASFISNFIPSQFKLFKRILVYFIKFNENVVTFFSKIKKTLTRTKNSINANRKRYIASLLISLMTFPIMFLSLSLSTFSSTAKIDAFSFSVANYLKYNNTNYQPNYLTISLKYNENDSLKKMNNLLNELNSSTLYRSQILYSKEFFSIQVNSDESFEFKITTLQDYSSYKTSMPKYNGLHKLNNYNIFTYYGPHNYKASSYFGFVYITDVIADKLIDNNSLYNSYDDIIYTPITLEHFDLNGQKVSNEYLITNIISTAYSTYFSKTALDVPLFLTNDLAINSNKANLSPQLCVTFYNNVYSVSKELKSVMNNFELNELEANFYQYDYEAQSYKHNQKLDCDFLELYSLEKNTFIGFVLPVLTIVLYLAFAFLLHLKYFYVYKFNLIISSILFTISFGIYSLLNYSFYYFGILFITYLLIFAVFYYLLKRWGNYEK